jgi:hypothetical protein
MSDQTPFDHESLQDSASKLFDEMDAMVQGIVADYVDCVTADGAQVFGEPIITDE